MIIGLLEATIILGCAILVDKLLKNEKLKLIAAGISVAFVHTYVIFYLQNEWFFFRITREYVVKWLAMAGMLYLLVHLRKTKYSENCPICGTEKVYRDRYCRRCGKMFPSEGMNN